MFFMFLKEVSPRLHLSDKKMYKKHWINTNINTYYYLLSPNIQFFHILFVVHFLFYCTFYSLFLFFCHIYALVLLLLYNSYFYSFALSTERT